MFTNANISDGANLPDVAQDSPTNDAQLLCSTSSAFLTSSGNIYSFLSPLALQLDDSTNFQTKNIFLQVNALGSTLELDSVRLIPPNAASLDDLISPTRSFVINQEALAGEFGGLGTSYDIQWDLSLTPITGTYTILFESSESSMSLDKISLDTFDTYTEVPIPLLSLPSPSIEASGGNITLSWPLAETNGAVLESTVNLIDPDTWTEVNTVPVSDGVNYTVTIPLSTSSTFFRLSKK